MSCKLNHIPGSGRSSGDGGRVSDTMPSFSDTVFGFLDVNYPLSGDSSLEEREWDNEEEEENEEENCNNGKEKKVFWDEQEKLLQGILCRTSSVESRVRNATKDALRKLDDMNKCKCHTPLTHGCHHCLRMHIFSHLSNVGFNCSIRTSKWKGCPEIPSGEHTYLEVIEKPGPNKAEVRVVIELNLRAEFEMAKASQDYNRLVNRLPEFYVGKPERLKNLIKLLCEAAKKCTKEKKIHMGPWRKHKYMRAKWLGQSVTAATSAVDLPVVEAVQFPIPLVKPPPRASMLTISLLDKLPRQQCQAVAVI